MTRVECELIFNVSKSSIMLRVILVAFIVTASSHYFFYFTLFFFLGYFFGGVFYFDDFVVGEGSVNRRRGDCGHFELTLLALVNSEER